MHYKYQEELHANEVAILPYYVANLNIEATYATITGQFEEYPNLCFVDTLDNIAALRASNRAAVGDLFGAMSEENIARIKRQNNRRSSSSLAIRHIMPTSSMKTRTTRTANIRKSIYALKIRTSSRARAENQALRHVCAVFPLGLDRVDENGIVAFVSNSSFIHKFSFDGFRKIAASEFNEIWLVDLKEDAHGAGEARRREGGNIFSNQIKVGIAISFLVKKRTREGCKIKYFSVRDYAKADEKLEFVRSNRLDTLRFGDIKPDIRGNWTNFSDNDFGDFIQVADEETKVVNIASRRACEILALLARDLHRIVMNGSMTSTDCSCGKKIAYLILNIIG